MKKKLLVFDMDGTIADFYGVDGWLEDLKNENPRPYIEAKPLVDIEKVVEMLNKVRDEIEIAIVTWGSKQGTKEFLKTVTKAKKQWLDRWGFPYDRFHCTKYGYSKRYPVSANKKRNEGIPEEQILFDDNPEVREDWEKWEKNKAFSENEMLDFLSSLVQEKEKNNEIDFHIPPNIKKVPELYMVLDCETATLPFIKEWDLTAKDKQKISIAKPLIYDIGWRVIDKDKNIYSQHSFLIQETFFVPNVFNTAYYSWKRPLYMDRYKKGAIKNVCWEQAMCYLIKDLKKVKYATAYNAMFDFKKAIPFTDSYISHLYDSTYQHWEDKQRKICEDILNGEQQEKERAFDNMNFELRGVEYPIADIWGIACERLINKDEYRFMCLEEGMISASGLYFKTSAEAAFRYLAKDISFEEEHTALSDAVIETDILCKALEKGEVPQGILYFPFKELGDTVRFMVCNMEKITFKMFFNVYKTIIEKLNTYKDYNSPFANRLYDLSERLEGYFPEYYRQACLVL